jgi:hypothetical protein
MLVLEGIFIGLAAVPQMLFAVNPAYYQYAVRHEKVAAPFFPYASVGRESVNMTNGNLFFVPDVQEQSVNPLEISVDERMALIALFEKTGGKDWAHRNGWLGPIGTECDWYGVECKRELKGRGYGSYTVIELDLTNNGLKGQVPPEVGGLRNLKSLILDGNDIKGPLPEGVLRMFDQAQLQVSPISLIHDIEEILVEVQDHGLLCLSFRAWMFADGNVRRERKMCRLKNGKETREVYFDYQEGKIHDFNRLARSFFRKDFFSDAPLSIRIGPWYVDGREISVTAKRIGGVSKQRSWNMPVSMAEYELEMQIYGVLAEVRWVVSPKIKK